MKKLKKAKERRPSQHCLKHFSKHQDKKQVINKNTKANQEKIHVGNNGNNK